MDLDVDSMYIARAHRLGQCQSNNRMQKRPLIANVHDYCDTETIMSKAFLLKGTPFSVDYDLPKEINEVKKALWSITRGGNSPRFSIMKIFQLNPELGQKCSEITNKMIKRIKHP